MLRALAVIALVVAPAAAEPRTAQLDYTGECSADALTARVRELAGREPFAGDGVTRVRVAVARDGAQLRGTVAIAEGERALGGRDVTADTCEALADGLALVITMVLSRPPPEPPPAVVPPPPPPVSPPVAPRSPGALHEVSMIAGVAVTPGAQVAGFGGLRARRAWLSASLELALLADDAFAEQGGMVRVSRFEAELVPCVHRGRVAGCAAVAAGRVRAAGEGFVASEDVRSPYVALGARLIWEQPLWSHVALRGQLEGRVALTAQRIRVDDAIVWESPRGELWAGLAVVAHIP